VNHTRLFQLYREERLMVRRRGGRKRALGTRTPMLVAIIGPLRAVNELIETKSSGAPISLIDFLAAGTLR
jgi:hypothetical protein